MHGHIMELIVIFQSFVYCSCFPVISDIAFCRVSPKGSSVEGRIPVEFIECNLADFKSVATLGMGGFGRVDLVSVCCFLFISIDFPPSFIPCA